MTATTETYDPFASAMDSEAPVRTYNYFGRCVVDAWPCVLVKGQKPQLFDATQHQPEQRRTRIIITIEPLTGSPLKQPIRRELIAESEEWTKTVRPSLQALGADLRGVNDHYVQIRLAETRAYKTTIVDDSGQVKEVEKKATQPVFLAIYPTEQACQDAAAALFGKAAPSDASTSVAAPMTSGEGERAKAAAFLPALWAMSGRDLAKFERELARMPATAAHFTVASPEVVAIIGGGN